MNSSSILSVVLARGKLTASRSVQQPGIRGEETREREKEREDERERERGSFGAAAQGHLVFFD